MKIPYGYNNREKKLTIMFWVVSISLSAEERCLGMVTKEAGEKIENTTKKNVFYPSALQDETGV